MDKLEQLKALDQEVIHLELEKKNKMRLVMGEEIARMVEEVELGYDEKKLEKQREISELENEIRGDVIILSDSVYSHCGYRVAYNAGRVKWDTKGLDGYAVAHPEVNVFRVIGEPSTSIYRK